MRSPVSHPESSEARNTAIGAMSSGWPRRPSGVLATICFSKSLPMMPMLVRALGLDASGIDGVDADLARAQLARQLRRHRIDGALGGRIDRRVRGRARLTTEPMLITLPPSGPKCLTASCVASIMPSTLVLNSRWNSSSVTSSSGSELVDAGVVDQHVQRAEGLLGLLEQPLHVGRLGYVALDGDRFAAACR